MIGQLFCGVIIFIVHLIRESGDLAENEVSRHLDNSRYPQYADRAIDGNMDTCSYTNVATATRTINPWWRVQFQQNEIIQSMLIVTRQEQLHNFKGFKVTVENAPADKATDGGYYPHASDVQLCYQHSNFAPSNNSIHVTCDQPLVGNLVRIQLARKDTQLVLCDVRINGGRNLAFKKNLEYSQPFNEDRYPPRNAVDGVLRNSARDYCFAIGQKYLLNPEWLTVNLGHPSLIKHISITKFDDNRIRYYQLYISNTTVFADGELVHNDTGYYPNLKVTLQTTGQFVTFNRPTGNGTVICELEIYGDCTAGKCGYDCSKDCHCKTIEDKISGVCASGCEGRWTGPGDQCINKCADLQWGENCENQCGRCRDSQSCDVVTGYCPFGCEDGSYLDTRRCNTECLDGTYGSECLLDCSGNCRDGDVCRKSDGHCERGCTAGYQGKICRDVCSSGWYGDNCSLSCSATCDGGYTYCHHVNGTCLLGCAAGFEGNMCDKECDDGYWNKNCETMCGSCLIGTCSKTTGLCTGGCLAGYRNTLWCTSECSDYTFGMNCGSICSTNCVDVCNKLNGTCNNCTTGWKGDTCSEACDNNTWGENCERPCGFCLSGKCDRFYGLCTGGCIPGYRTTTMCTEECPAGTYGAGCSGTCSTSCKIPVQCDHVNGHCESCGSGKQGPYCDEDCNDKSYGKDCSKQCGACANNETCNSVSGQCKSGCDIGFKHSLLCQEECDDYTFGMNCGSRCSTNCVDVCDKVNGSCNNCRAGWKGDTCSEACGNNTWGENCDKPCGFCLSGPCDRFTGHCTGECLSGYKTTTMCTEECPAGSYGARCSGTCSTICKIPGRCNNVNGHCESCGAGNQGAYCDEDCDDNSYGEDCSKQCGACANNETCNSVSGQCTLGCNIGYKHSFLCQEDCDDGLHGKNCTGICGNCKQGTVCDKVTGVCHYGCFEKFTGPFCIEALTQKSKEFPIGGVVGGVVAFIVVVVTLVLVFLFMRRRKAQLHQKSASQTGIDTILTQGSEVNAGRVQMNDIYENLPGKEADLGKSKASQNSTNKENEVGIYYKEEPFVKHRSEHFILVSDLKDYVKKRTANAKYFLKEFQKLPSGLQHPTSVAKKPGNTGKNRNRAIYAYDHSRVVLTTLPGQPNSDYINATFMKGYFKDKAYIAAQDPIDFTLVDFWRMIWGKDVYSIVMVTKQEESKIKCAQYWAEADDSVQHGNINIRTESVDISAEFTVRHLKVSHQDNPDSARNITQFHYTTWLNEDVPLNTTSFLHFWYQVRKHDGQKKHPWLVHCSNGVGRTGTLIALEILYEQGKDQGCVDVFGCVKDLRDQRVSMVQTKEEYRFLHNMLVEVLLLPSKHVHVDEFPALYSDLQEIDPETGRTKAELQYETLIDNNDGENEYTDIDEMCTSTKQLQKHDKFLAGTV